MSSHPAAAPSHAASSRADRLYEEHLQTVHERRDRVFGWLTACQWLLAMGIAVVYSPYAWSGKVHTTHLHLYYAVFVGGALTLPVLALIRWRPGSALTRHWVAVAQMLFAALFIHLTGGRIETHFAIFGSLAFLAFYRDWKVLLTATVVVAGEHLLRGLAWSESVYGITNPEWWRFLEHAFWVIFEDIVLVMGVLEQHREMRALAARQAELESLNASIEQKVVDRTAELEASREQYRSLVETTRTVPWQMAWLMDPDGRRFTYVGPQGAALLGSSNEAWLHPGFFVNRVHAEDRPAALALFDRAANDHQDGEAEFRMVRDDGSLVWVRAMVSAGNGSGTNLRGLFLDITERRQLEMELRQAQKLESVGRLASGVAHEINTPIQFVSDSLHFIREAFGDAFNLIAQYQAMRQAVSDGVTARADAIVKLEQAEEDADIGYLSENVPKALDRSVDGLNRVATLVRSMKEFAHPDQKEKMTADLNHALNTTLTIARNEYKYVADVETDLGQIPSLLCHVNELNQVFLNIIVNAAHAISDVVKGTDRRGKITIRTRSEAGQVVISIEDTGGGIPEAVRPRIFDPFFTTKEVGKGTGQGLAIARNVVVEKHGGAITFESQVGKGTTFVIRLPRDAAEAPLAAQVAA